MPSIADMVEQMIARGVAPDLIVMAVRVAEECGVSTRQSTRQSTGIPPDSPVDTTAQHRREWDRNRKRVHRNSTGIPPDSPPDTKTPSLSEEVITGSSKKEKERKREAPKRNSGGHRLPEDWQPSDPDSEIATKALGPDRARRELEKFRDYWLAKPGKDATKSDWNATWRNWTRRAVEFGNRDPPKKPPGDDDVVWRNNLL